MNNVTLEKIDILVERAQISYKEAKEILEKHEGDLIEALIEAETYKRSTSSRREAFREAKKEYKEERRREKEEFRRERSTDSWDRFVKGVNRVISQLNKTSFVVSDREKQYLDVPLSVVIILTVITLPFSLILLVLPYCFGANIAIYDKNGKERTVSETYHDFEDTVKEAASEPIKRTESSESEMN